MVAPAQAQVEGLTRSEPARAAGSEAAVAGRGRHDENFQSRLFQARAAVVGHQPERLRGAGGVEREFAAFDAIVHGGNAGQLGLGRQAIAIAVAADQQVDLTARRRTKVGEHTPASRRAGRNFQHGEIGAAGVGIPGALRRAVDGRIQRSDDRRHQGCCGEAQRRQRPKAGARLVLEACAGVGFDADVGQRTQGDADPGFGTGTTRGAGAVAQRRLAGGVGRRHVADRIVSRAGGAGGIHRRGAEGRRGRDLQLPAAGEGAVGFVVGQDVEQRGAGVLPQHEAVVACRWRCIGNVVVEDVAEATRALGAGARDIGGHHDHVFVGLDLGVAQHRHLVVHQGLAGGEAQARVLPGDVVAAGEGRTIDGAQVEADRRIAGLAQLDREAQCRLVRVALGHRGVADAQARLVVGDAVVVDKRCNGIVVADQCAGDVRERDVEPFVFLGRGIADGGHRELRRGGAARDRLRLEQHGREVGVLGRGEVAGGKGVRLCFEADQAGGRVRQGDSENDLGGASVAFHHLGVEHRQRGWVVVGDDRDHALAIANHRADDVTQVDPEMFVALHDGFAADLELQRVYRLASGNDQAVQG